MISWCDMFSMSVNKCDTALFGQAELMVCAGGGSQLGFASGNGDGAILNSRYLDAFGDNDIST